MDSAMQFLFEFGMRFELGFLSAEKKITCRVQGCSCGKDDAGYEPYMMDGGNLAPPGYPRNFSTKTLNPNPSSLSPTHSLYTPWNPYALPS